METVLGIDAELVDCWGAPKGLHSGHMGIHTGGEADWSRGAAAVEFYSNESEFEIWISIRRPYTLAAEGCRIRVLEGFPAVLLGTEPSNKPPKKTNQQQQERALAGGTSSPASCQAQKRSRAASSSRAAAAPSSSDSEGEEQPGGSAAEAEPLV